MENIEKLNYRPFTRFCMSIGAVPSSYLAGLSIEEQLLWLCSYLEKEVIPAVNNNGEAVEELQNLYVELKTYVDNYFDNLDVQEEINNKLDSMVEDGTFDEIINQELFSQINAKIDSNTQDIYEINSELSTLTDVNQRILQNSENIGTINQEMNNKISSNQANSVNMNMLTQEVRESLTGGSTPIVAKDSVGTENIKDKAVTIYKLEDILQNNFINEYEGVDFSFNFQGYKNVVDNELNISTDTFYSYADIPLTINTTYYFSGFNIFAIQGIVVIDSLNNIIYKAPITDITQRHEAVNIVFRANTAGLHAIINSVTTTTNMAGNYPSPIKLLPSLSKLKLLRQNFMNSPDLTPAPIKTIEGYYVSFDHASTIENTVPYFVTHATASVDIYKLSKGLKYSVTGANRSSICGLQITDESFNVSYQSSYASTSPIQYFTYEFTASNNGYALITSGTVGADTFEGLLRIVGTTEENRYTGKKWGIIGDSLSDPDVNNAVTKYYKYIENDLGITINNVSESGCGYKRIDPNNVGGKNFVEQSLSVDSNCDIVSIFGSFNDNHEFTNMGTTSDTTTDTIFGCVYNTFLNLITRCPNAKIFVILPTPWISYNPYNINSNISTYIEGIKTIAKKFSIPVLDLFFESNMFPWNDSFKANFYVSSDGVHPNTQGNERFAYKIESVIKELI